MSALILPPAFSILPPIFGATLVLQTVVEYLAYVLAIILVTMIVTLWIAGNRVTLRQSDGRPDESRRRSARRLFGQGDGKSASSGKRRRRRSHRRRNPTLAETGGLPPIRTQTESSPPEQPEP
jgi:hypothetical protein